MNNLLASIEYASETEVEPIHRIPDVGSALFKVGTTLTVHDGQVAVFYRNGKALDVFEPGQYEISKENIPLLVTSLGNQFSEDRPFAAEVYFVSVHKFVDRKWGTPAPILVSDPQSTSVPLLSAFGTYSYQVINPQKFVEEIGGQGINSSRRLNDLENLLRNRLLSLLTIVIGEMGEKYKSGAEITRRVKEITATVHNKAKLEFSNFGIALLGFEIVNISPPRTYSEKSPLKEIWLSGIWTAFIALLSAVIGFLANITSSIDLFSKIPEQVFGFIAIAISLLTVIPITFNWIIKYYKAQMLQTENAIKKLKEKEVDFFNDIEADWNALIGKVE